jgi:hypothetical protein
MRSTPRIPPTTARMATFPTLRSYPIRRIAGIVKTTPAAIDSPAEPVVWTMLFSRMVEPKRRKNATAITAIGIDAETVRPILRAR